MAITQKSRIKIRSGLLDDLPQLATGELGWAIDARKLYIGNGLTEEGAPSLGNSEVLTEHSPLSFLNIDTSNLVMSASILPLGIYSPGANTISISARSADVLRMYNPLNTVNNLYIWGGATGVGPTISSYGETNRDINIDPIGSGNLKLISGTVVISDMTAARIVYTGASGALSSTAGLQYDGTHIGLGSAPNGSWGSTIHAVQLATGASVFGDATDGAFIGANTVATDSGYVSINTAVGSLYSLTGGAHTWYNIPSVVAGSAQTPVVSMKLSTTYALGIGITPNTLPASYSGIQLLSHDVASDNSGTTYFYNNAVNDNGTERYTRITGATLYKVSPTGHEWTVSDGTSHIPNDTITWLATPLKVGVTGLVTAANGIATSIITATDITYAVLATDTSIISNYAGIQTVTLPVASANPGRVLNMRTITANTVVSATANVVPLIGGAAGTAILAGVAGTWAMLQSDGTNWQIMSGN